MKVKTNINIDDQILDLAKLEAVAKRTSVSALIEKLLEKNVPKKTKSFQKTLEARRKRLISSQSVLNK